MATENLLMAAVTAGGDRQDLHERIRVHSLAAADSVKQGGANDLLDRLKAEPAFAAIDVDALIDPSRFVGRAPEQVDVFLRDVVEPIRRRYPKCLAQTGEVRI
jgi:adenylosuccinate lyase